MGRPVFINKSGLLQGLVGDAGLEPATSTMSTWRSTPELIARLSTSDRAFSPLSAQKGSGAPLAGAVRY
jgi:hypothetical protein